MINKTSKKLTQWINTPTTVKTVTDWSTRMGIIAFLLVKIVLVKQSKTITIRCKLNYLMEQTLFFYDFEIKQISEASCFYFLSKNLL